MRLWLVIALSLCLTATAGGQAYRTATPVSYYAVLAAMFRQAREGAVTEQMERPLFTLEPLVAGLAEKYDGKLGERLAGAIGERDRRRIVLSLLVIVLADGEDLLSQMSRDELGGWTRAQVFLRKALLDFGLGAATLRMLDPKLEGETRSEFETLSRLMQFSDLTSDPEPINAQTEVVRMGLRRARQLAAKRADAADVQP
jgi:hypothetical protein